MIKLIEPGTKTVAECYNCGCKFSYEKEDIQSRPHKIPDGCAPMFYDTYIECPQCHKSITLKTTR